MTTWLVDNGSALAVMLSIGGLIYYIGTFKATVVTRLDNVDNRIDTVNKTMNGPLKEQFDSTRKHTREALDQSSANHDLLLQLPCAVHGEKLSTLEGDVDTIKRRYARIEQKPG